MTTSTKVVNLRTGLEQYFTLPPTEAVIAAWEQAQGNNNTWTYGDGKAPVKQGAHTVSAGDFCALLRGAA